MFIFFSFDKHSPHIEFYQIAFFANYAIAALLINYVLLPRFFNNGKYWVFIIGVIFLIGLVILMEEQVLEKIFLADSKGKSFPGVIFSLLEISPTILILTGFKFAWDAHQKHREVTTLQQNIKESEMRFLKSQINPHFLFNNLNNLYSYAIENSPKTPFIILELSSILRYMLYDCKADFVPLEKEINHLQDFTKLNELQIEERGEVVFKQEPFLGDYLIAPLILSVFVENAFKHSTTSQNDNIVIDIFINVNSSGVLHFVCKNSFLPLGNMEGLSKGIGLENVKKRLELIYSGRHQLNIKEMGNLYVVDLKIKLKK